MVNFGPLTAEIGSGVWGTSANFNGFRVLAALLHGTLVKVGVSQTLRRWTEGATYIRQGNMFMVIGIGAHSSCICIQAIPLSHNVLDQWNKLLEIFWSGAGRQLLTELARCRPAAAAYLVHVATTDVAKAKIAIIWCMNDHKHVA